MNRKNITVGDWVTSQTKVGKIVSEGKKEEFLVLWSGDSRTMNELATSLQIVNYDGEDLAGKTFKDGRCNRLVYEYGVKAEVSLNPKKKPQVWSLEKLNQQLNNFSSQNGASTNKSIMLSLSQIRGDGGTQPRASINDETVMEYAEDMNNGDRFPPVTVFYDGNCYWLADGFHREQAALKAGFTEIAAIVKQGTRRDAVLYSVGANAKHGLRRTNADKRRAVMTLLEDSEWTGWSNNAIASQCGVSHQFVNNLRKSILQPLQDTKLNNQRKVKRGGKTYIQDTTNIGKSKSLESSPPAEEEKELTTSSQEQELNTPREELRSPQEKKELTKPPSSQENNHSSDTPIETNIRKLLSEGDRVRIKDNHHCGGQYGIVTFIPNRNCGVVEFSPGKKEVIQYQDFDFDSINTPPQPSVKKEIIIQEGLNYKAGNPGYGCKWYVEVREQTYKGLEKYQEKVGTPTIDSAIARFLDKEKENIPNSDDIVLYFLNNVQQLPRERVNLILEAFAKTHYDAFVQTLQVIKSEKTLRLV